MKLIEIVENLNDFDADNTIYAIEPWLPEVEAIVLPMSTTNELPESVRIKGLTYFLEISIARDFLYDWESYCESPPSAFEKVSRLIQYALTDA